MRILFVTPECAPLTKTGGLGDVSAALPAALRAQGHEVRVLLPAYPGSDVRAERAHTLRLLDLDVRILETPDLLLLDCPPLYQRPGGPYLDAEGKDWDDNALRFAVLSRAAALLSGESSPLDWRPDVLHCNDWPTGLAPVYLHAERGRAASVMTIHNLAFQGLFDARLLARLELPAACFSVEGLEFYGKLSFLKGGIVYADAVTTVSATYSREIQEAELGCGLDGVLRERRDRLRGIVNGIDTGAWDPTTDTLLVERYSSGSLDRKAANKLALQERMGLAAEPGLPLFGAVCRFTEQKGMDLVAVIADEIVAMPAQLCVLGKGERELESRLVALAERHPGKVAVRVGFDEPLAHLVEAGADAFLMPSRFEPCGLNQMYSQRYGTPPVAHATGGLADTIVDGETGFLFQGAAPDRLAAAMRRALDAYREPRRWREIQRRGMARDFSWAIPARQYGDLYAHCARMRRP
jgi:starch synthase